MDYTEAQAESAVMEEVEAIVSGQIPADPETLKSAMEFMGDASKLMFEVGRLTGMSEENGRHIRKANEALRQIEQEQRAAAMAKGIEQKVASESDHVLRSPSAGMLGDVRSGSGPFEETARDRK